MTTRRIHHVGGALSGYLEQMKICQTLLDNPLFLYKSMCNCVKYLYCSPPLIEPHPSKANLSSGHMSDAQK